MSRYEANMHQIRFWLGLDPRPHWEITVLPRPPSEIYGDILLRAEKGGKED